MKRRMDKLLIFKDYSRNQENAVKNLNQRYGENILHHEKNSSSPFNQQADLKCKVLT